MSTAIESTAHHEHHLDMDSIDVFGFWLYIMTDCILFAALFAAFIVLHAPGYYGPNLKQFIELPYVLGETFFLLGSNLTFGLCMIAFYRSSMTWTRLWLFLTFILGLGFVAMEVNEFIHLHHLGFSWYTSGAASSFFVLVGTHGFHVSMGLLWISVLFFQMFSKKLQPSMKKRMIYLGLFWNFLDIVWIFLFTIVYLMGAL